MGEQGIQILAVVTIALWIGAAVVAFVLAVADLRGVADDE